jgi:hypothetical protein
MRKTIGCQEKLSKVEMQLESIYTFHCNSHTRMSNLVDALNHFFGVLEEAL